MYIIIANNKTIIKISNDNNTKKSVEEYFNTIIESDKYFPKLQHVTSVEYSILNDSNEGTEGSKENKPNEFKLIKIQKFCNKGYIYNTKKTREIELDSVIILSYKSREQSDITSLEAQLIDKLNERVLSNMDRDELLQFILKFKNEKDVYYMNDMLSTHKKKLYADIAAKMKRFGDSKKFD